MILLISILDLRKWFIILNSALQVDVLIQVAYSNYQYSFRSSYRDILLVAGISIPLFESQVKNRQHLPFKTQLLT
jgi:hypothetical protein